MRAVSVLFLVDLHCEHCRATLPPFGTVGNGRFGPPRVKLFSAKVAKQRAGWQLLSQTVRTGELISVAFRSAKVALTFAERKATNTEVFFPRS